MDSNHSILFVAFLILCLTVNGVTGYATVTGTVFCDQCKDGEKSLFDFPVSGIKVSVTCLDENGQVYMSREETTNWLGGYVMRFDGTPDLSNCYAQVSDNGAQQGSSSSCSIASGPAQKLKLLFSFFGIETFIVDALLAQPVQPMSSCPKPPPAPVMPPPQAPLPPLPPIPPVPFVEPSACCHKLWIRPEYRCYWKVIGPDTKVAVAFGLVAGRRYGTDMTVGEALKGRGEAYKTLLREATTALLNSYNSLGFPYNSVAVITYTNMALLGNSQHDVLMTAIRFIKANSGTCKFTDCK
ncbi:BnaA09g08790D [Brassica napus]|uniref:BnaA09g08790D protein n=1 Tax=Brassica napus TaxID=3708 RepID=A0A078I956_BRANA|nr:BnaA09g08790D [Brassica napus]